MVDAEPRPVVRVLITGAAGQLGVELLRTAPSRLDVVGLSRQQCDISDARSVDHAVSTHRPDVVINAAGYTAVDAAEGEVDLAYSVNATGAGNVARAAKRLGARLIHISTDYVFDGASDVPYTRDSVPNPLSVYGASKLAGEIEVRQSNPGALVLRSGWLYAAQGDNFLRTILGALQASRGLRVVNDQIGVPTSAPEFAGIIWSCVDRSEIEGIQHWVNDGTASWYDFAVQIQELALTSGLVDSRNTIAPVTSAAYGSRAKRPRYSVLDARELWQALGTRAAPWNDALFNVFRNVGSTQSLGRSSIGS